MTPRVKAVKRLFLFYKQLAIKQLNTMQSVSIKYMTEMTMRLTSRFVRLVSLLAPIALTRHRKLALP